MGQNYFNSLPLRLQLEELGKCRFMDRSEFADGCNYLKGKKIVIVGCGAQGLNQGLNLRDSGLDVSYALRDSAIAEKRQSWKNASENGFNVGTYEELIPTADVVMNLTPDKQHTSVVNAVMPLMKDGACLDYAHGFNLVEEGMQIRPDITVVMCCPKCPGTEVREEYKRGFGVPTLIAVHRENDPKGEGMAIAKMAKMLDLNTYVEKNCNSMCAIIFLSGKARQVTKKAVVGVHAAYNKNNGMRGVDANSIISWYLGSWGYPEELVHLWVGTSPKKIFNINSKTADQLGLGFTTIEPVKRPLIKKLLSVD